MGLDTPAAVRVLVDGAGAAANRRGALANEAVAPQARLATEGEPGLARLLLSGWRMNKLIASLLIVLSLSSVAHAEPVASPTPHILMPAADVQQLHDRKVRSARGHVIAGALLLGVGVSVGAGLMATGGRYYGKQGNEDDLIGFVYLGSGAAVLTAMTIAGGITLADGISQNKKARVQLTNVGIGPVQGGAVANAGIRF